MEVEALAHCYGERHALRGISLAVSGGELLGVLGPNGGGKTTLLQILSTLIVPTRGTATIAGIDVVRRPAEARRRIGVVFQSPSLDPYLTARENLRHQAHLHGLRGARSSERIGEILARLGVDDRADDLVRTLSGGLRRRVELGKAFLHNPQVLLLDEPTVGLDPGGRRELWRHLLDLRADDGVAAVIATHRLEEAEACDRVVFLDRGLVVAEGTPHALKEQIRGDVVSLEALDAPRLAAAVADRFGVDALLVDGRVRIERPDGAAFVPRLAEAFPGLIRSITVGKPTLEDVFVQRTGHRFWQDGVDDTAGDAGESAASESRR